LWISLEIGFIRIVPSPNSHSKGFPKKNGENWSGEYDGQVKYDAL
jgi:hypothetical protein